MILCYIQHIKYSVLERRRCFRQCYFFVFEDFFEIALIYYFKRYMLNLIDSLFFFYIANNYIRKKLHLYKYIYCNYVLLKYTFIKFRFMRKLLLIYTYNYSILRRFIIFSIKLHFLKENKTFYFINFNYDNCKINYYF